MSHDQKRFTDALWTLWPHADQHAPGLRQGIVDSAAAGTFEKYGADTDLAVALLMGQYSEECGAGEEMVENMNYSAPRLLQVFPTHFTPQQAILYQHNPRQIADHAYGGRMGNAPPPSDDGWNCRGQGLSQLTGAANYKALQEKFGLKVYDHPEIITAPATCLEVAVADARMCGCIPYALKGDVLSVSGLLNFGHIVNAEKINGYSMRVHWTALWKHAMGVA